MSDDKFEKLSAFMDGETELTTAELKQLYSDDEMSACWSRYHVIRETLTQRVNIPVADDWHDKLQAQLDSEPVVLAPAAARSDTPRSQRMFKQVAGFAVAATVAAIAIVSLQNNQLDPALQSTPELATATPAASGTPVNRNIARVSGKRLSQEETSKLSGYIVNHYEYSMTGKLQGMLPYMRIVSETPAVKVQNDR